MAVPSKKTRFTDTWGSVSLGSMQVTGRQIALWGGIAGWLIAIFVQTGREALSALAFNVVFILELMAVAGLLAETVSPRRLGTLFISGGFLAGIAIILEYTLVTYVPDLKPPVLAFLMPPIEELVKVLPLLWMLWQGRKFTNWTMGASDILLMGACLGAGFGFIEDAFTHKNGWQSQIIGLPTAEIVSGHLIAGHAVWTAIAAATIGLALMMRHRGGMAWLIAGAGVVWATLDHMACNYNRLATDYLSGFLNIVTLNGYLSVGFLVLGIFAAIGIDLFAQNGLPKFKEFDKLKPSKDGDDNNRWINFVFDKRRLSYAYFRYRQALKSDLPNCALVVATLTQCVMNEHEGKRKRVSQVSMPEPPPVRRGGISAIDFVDDLEVTLSTTEYQTPETLEAAKEYAQRIDLPPNYRLINKLSEGGMGIIFKAVHRMTGAKLAIKILHPHVAKTKKNLTRFVQEAKAAANLNHPNLVTVHDFGITDKQVAFLVMDLIEGPSLQAEIKKNRQLQLDRFLSIFTQVCDGCSHAHKRKVVHRDIKPSNILLSRTDDGPEVVKVVDFGIAKVLGDDDNTQSQSLTKTGDLVGSPLYMSPEQSLGTDLDARSDIYSLGCVMYEGLMGEPPFVGINTVQTIFKHVHEDPRPFITVRPDLEIPDQLEKIVLRCMQKNPDDRYPSMDELKTDLEFIRQSWNWEQQERVKGKFRKEQR